MAIAASLHHPPEPLLAGWTDPADEPAWMSALRRKAERRFGEMGLPLGRHERWKYTDLKRAPGLEAAIAPRQPHGLSAADLPPPLLPGSHRLVFVDGRLAADLGDGNGGLGEGVATLGLIEALPLDQGALKPALEQDFDVSALAPDQGLRALNAARFEDGAIVHLTPNREVDTPIELLFLTTQPGRAAYPRSILWLERGSTATIVERHLDLGAGAEPTLGHPMMRVVLGEAARLVHLQDIHHDRPGTHVLSHDLMLERGAGYHGFALVSGAGVTRREVDVRLQGEGAEAFVDGALLMEGEASADVLTNLRHLVPHTSSTTRLMGVIGGAASGTFQGRVEVAQGAVGTDGRQLSRGLLLSGHAAFNTKPQLEIYADDVQCAHGATIGQLDEAALFYLRARGIPEVEARALLIRAFLGEVVDPLPEGPVREAVTARVEERFARLLNGGSA